MKQKRVLSGIRATGRLHLGNLLGAVDGMLQLQNDPNYETLFMVADVHTITTPYSAQELRNHRKQVFIDYISAGLDPEKSIIFIQSNIPEHLELAFYFSSVVSIARMQHLPTFKDKVKQYPQNATLALLNYPALMSADILIYKAELVPVGIDQEPHLEVAREIARKMNELYETDFPEPKRFATEGQYIPSLLGKGKMSKSVEGSAIFLSDDLETIKKRIAKIPTDSGKGAVSKIVDGSSDTYEYVNESKDVQDGVATLMEFVEHFLSQNHRLELHKQYESDGIRYGEVKAELAHAIFTRLEPIRQKRAELVQSTTIDEHIREGASRAQTIASQTVREVREKMGLA